MLLTLEGKGKPSHLRCCAYSTPAFADIHRIPKSKEGMIQYFDPTKQKTVFCLVIPHWADHTSDESLQSAQSMEEEYISKKGFERMLKIFVDQSKEPFKENPLSESKDTV